MEEIAVAQHRRRLAHRQCAHVVDADAEAIQDADPDHRDPGVRQLPGDGAPVSSVSGWSSVIG